MELIGSPGQVRRDYARRNAFAMMEAVLLLSTIVRKARFSPGARGTVRA